MSKNYKLSSIAKERKRDGNGRCALAWNGGGADYAEWREKHPDHYANDESDWVGVVVALLDGYIVKAVDFPDAHIIGIVSGDAAVVGNNDMQWKGKYLLDDHNVPLKEDYQVAVWEEVVTTYTEEERQVTVEQTEEKTVIKLIDGVATQVVETVTKKVPQFTTHLVFDGDGNPILDNEGEQSKHFEPVMETIKVPYEETKPRQCVVGEEPEGVTIPTDAVYTTMRRKKLNPDFDPTLEHVSREDRPEWVCVGLMGFVPMNRDQVVNGQLLLNDRWLIGKDNPAKTTIEVFVR